KKPPRDTRAGSTSLAQSFLVLALCATLEERGKIAREPRHVPVVSRFHDHVVVFDQARDGAPDELFDGDEPDFLRDLLRRSGTKSGTSVFSAFEDRRLDEAWTERRRANAVELRFDAKRQGQPDDGVLARRVRDRARKRDEARDRGRVHDVPE